MPSPRISCSPRIFSARTSNWSGTRKRFEVPLPRAAASLEYVVATIAHEEHVATLPLQIEASDTPEETRTQLVDAIRTQINPYLAAGWAMIDDVIDPRETRRVIFQALELTRNKTVERPRRKHGVLPV